MVFPTSRREREAPWRIVPPTEVGKGSLSLWGQGGKANQEPNYPLIRSLGIGGILEHLCALLSIRKLSSDLGGFLIFL